MRIEGNWPGWRQAYETSKTQAGRLRPERRPDGAEPAPRGSEAAGDAVVISRAARELASAPAAGAGETREQRIARLREQIAAGTYRVDPERLADRLLARWTRGTQAAGGDGPAAGNGPLDGGVDAPARGGAPVGPGGTDGGGEA